MTLVIYVILVIYHVTVIDLSYDIYHIILVLLMI